MKKARLMIIILVVAALALPPMAQARGGGGGSFVPGLCIGGVLGAPSKRARSGSSTRCPILPARTMLERSSRTMGNTLGPIL